jgi:hypothetical protein
MNRIKLISLMVNMLLIINLHAGTIKPVIVFKADKSQVTVGGLITLTIQVKGTGIKYVSWNLCDSVIANIDKVTVLQTDTPRNGIKSLQHTIVFTSTKPGIMIVDHLPVVIYSSEGDYTLFTNRSIFKFKDETLVSNINDINPITVTRLLPLKYLLYFALSLMIIITLFSAGNRSLKKNKREVKMSPQEIRMAAIEKLELLELEMINAPGANSYTRDMIFELLKDFLEQVFLSKKIKGNENEMLKNINSLPLENGEKELIIDILNLSLNTRFSIQNNSLSTTVYMDRVKSFVSGFALPPLIKV